MVRKAVILAAGDGTRLGIPIPKTLVSIGLRPLLAHTLKALQHAGIREVLIVSGARADRLWLWVGLHRTDYRLKIRVVHNPHWFQTTNGTSLLMAQRWIPPYEPFLFLMGDHFLSHRMIQQAAWTTWKQGAVCLVVDQAPGPWLDLKEATKVQLDGTRIRKIGKHLDAFDGIDTGLFLATPRFFHWLSTTRGSVTQGVQQAADYGEAFALPVQGELWLDIDTLRDLSRIQALRWNDAHAV